MTQADIPAKPSYRWITGRTGDLYANTDGRIIGEVPDWLAGGSGFAAIVGGRHLGDYIDRASARAAVERATSATTAQP